ncbi:hypothetical protein [Cohnella terricola]|uniref:Uncharacterized protein n=1 Tax=Cohnella terricola TaxID=1289167 RepID=A0A559J4S0_9BACL|nr:hypothetical protein [Cohnella terricola]TVX94885.1 hypothetical protein FPZ45_24550 [Cohnella terricola]
MILTYPELKDDVRDCFMTFHEDMKNPIKESLYATLGESEHHLEFTQTNECCIYVNYALIMIDMNEDIDFMRQRLKELLEEEHMQIYKEELQDDFDEFNADILKLKVRLPEIDDNLCSYEYEVR